MTRGKQHDLEPEVDSLSFIDFEEAPDDGSDRWNWQHEMVGHVLLEVFGAWQTGSLIVDTTSALMMAHSTDVLWEVDENALWKAVARWCNAHGFDTYDSDSRFELFPGGTPTRDEAEAIIVNGDPDDILEEAFYAMEGIITIAKTDGLGKALSDPPIARAERSLEQIRRYLFTPEKQRVELYPDDQDNADLHDETERQLGGDPS